MKLLKLYENIITENEAEKCVKLYGRELFGTQFGSEMNNNLEKKTARDIRMFTDLDYGTKLNSEFVKEIKNLQKCISSFPEILQSEGLVYRGEKISIRELLPYIKTLNDNGELTFKYNSKSPIESWTSNYDTAMDYSQNHNKDNYEKLMNILKSFSELKTNEEMGNFITEIINDGFLDIKVSLVLKHEANSNSFLFKSKYFNKLSMYPTDDELIRVDTKPILCTSDLFINGGKYRTTLFNLLKIINQMK